MTPRTLRLTLAYAGTNYVGWQRQARGTSVQGVLEAALERVLGTPIALAGAGRTDAGVHAIGQVASLVTHHPMETWALQRALNALLPRDVRVTTVVDAPPGFHARFSASRKTYAYRIYRGRVMSPFDRPFSWHYSGPLDLEPMRQALGLLAGEHDFAAFQSAGSDVSTSIRHLFDAQLHRIHGRDLGELPHLPDAEHLVIRLCADGFLRHMVRSIVGTLVDVGRGRRPAEEMREILESRDRTRAGPTAPACGLLLERVDYVEPS